MHIAVFILSVFVIVWVVRAVGDCYDGPSSEVDLGDEYFLDRY